MTIVCHFKSNNVGVLGSRIITIRNAIRHNAVEHPDKARDRNLNSVQKQFTLHYG